MQKLIKLSLITLFPLLLTACSGVHSGDTSGCINSPVTRAQITVDPHLFNSVMLETAQRTLNQHFDVVANRQLRQTVNWGDAVIQNFDVQRGALEVNNFAQYPGLGYAARILRTEPGTVEIAMKGTGLGCQAIDTRTELNRLHIVVKEALDTCQCQCKAP